MRHNSHQRPGGGRPKYAYRSHGRGNQRRRHTKPGKKYIDPKRFIKPASTEAAEAYEPVNTFADFQLHPHVHQSIQARGFDVPSPIQDQAIPAALEGKDVVGVANTGTGKTAAFLLPLISKLLHNPTQQVLIMAPTRELALQIENEFILFAKGMRLYSALCIGGTPIAKQIGQLNRNPHLIIGTPGRLKDLIERRKLKLDRCHSVVLDEVDRMVDMGFINDMKRILQELPRERQSLFMTATVPKSVEAIMHSFLSEPITITVKTGDTAENVEQDVVRMQKGESKIDKLHSLLAQNELEKVLVFGETKQGVERLSRDLNNRGIISVSIHGDKTQSQRQRALSQFRDNHAEVMIATDVAARGLDIDNITHVINYDTPQNYEDYTHRVGRAGRAGKRGYALTFVS